MKILITGATGFVGKNLISEFSENYAITILTRNKLMAKKQFDKSIQVIELDYSNNEQLIDELNTTNVIINLAGDNIASSRWTKRKKESILASRSRIGKLLTDSILQSSTKPKLFIQASAIGYYGFNVTKPIDESNEQGSGFLAEVCSQWENSTSELDKHDIKRAIVRIGVVLGNNGGMLSKLIMPIKYFLGVHLGSGNNYLSWIHINDLISSVDYIVKNELEGIFNLTAPNPVKSKELNKTIAKKLKRPIWMHIPKGIIQLIFGEMANELLMSNQNVLPTRLKNEGFKFKYPEIKTAIDSLI